MEMVTSLLSIYPNDIDVLYAHSLLALYNTKEKVALRSLRHIVKLDPNHIEALNTLGYTLSDLLGRHQEAIPYLQRAHQLAPENPAILDSLGWALFHSGQHKIGLSYLATGFG